MPASRRRGVRRVLSAAALYACIAAAAGAAPAHGRSLDILEFASSIVVTRDGGIRVTERITVRFVGEWNGIYRTIPVEYQTDQGMRYELRLKIASVTDDAGNALRFEEERDGGNRRVKMWVPGATDATRTVILTYTSPNALRFFEEHDELYWNVTGDQWDFPIRSTRAEVILPSEATGMRATSFAGRHGSAESGSAAENIGNAFYFREDRPLGYRDGLTIVVGWNPGLVHRPTAAERAGSMLAANSILGLPVLAFFVMFGLWRRFGRDPTPESIFVRYEPPPGMTPAEAGTLIDDRPDLRDITATLVDLAVRGFVIIDEVKQDQLFGLLSTRDYRISLLRPEAWPTLKPHERALLQSLSVHAHDDTLLLSDLQNEFYKHLPEIRKHLHRSLIDGGHYVRRPDHVRGFWMAAAAVTGVVVAVLGGALSSRFHVAAAATLIAAGACFIIIAVFGWLMPARTVAGARAHAWLCGFQEFLARVEKDRLERLQQTPETFERYLPFAMAFGVEKNWARAFNDLASQPPDWYHTADGRPFRPGLFVSDLGRMTSVAGSAMSSAPRSSGSGSSGSSGFSGGSSGGGFGGGGGGGF